MRRLKLSALAALLVLVLATPSFAGWGYGFGWHAVPFVRHYAAGWGHHPFYSHYRPFSYRSYGYRSYGYHSYRPFGYRYYSYPMFGYSYVPRYRYYSYRYYAPTRYYYSYPYCASYVTPSFGSSYSSYSLAARTLPTPARDERATATATPWIRLAERLVKEVAAPREAPDSRLVSRTHDDAGSAATAKPLTTAGRSIELGDTSFRGGRYELARTCYASACAAAPTSAAAHFRYGQALIATGRYHEAVAAIKQGLAIDPALHSRFRLHDIYSGEAEQTRQVEALAATALKQPYDADVLFLIGAFLHFEGKSQRAEKFLNRAAELAGKDTQHIQQFLVAGRRAAPLRLTSDFSTRSETDGPF